jgi:tetratricopeptide (TPR) repeat protein
MSKYNCDLDYLTLDCDISNEEIIEIINEADEIIISDNIDPDKLSKAYLKKSQCLQKLGRFEESKEILEKALQLSPEMPEALLQLGNVYNFVEEKYEIAIECFDKALAINPEYVCCFHMKANVYLKIMDIDKALLEYKKAIEIKPDYVTAYINRGTIYFNKKEYGNAILDFEKVCQLVPNHAFALFNLGILYKEIADNNKAIEFFTKVICLKPDDIEAIYNRGILYIEKHEYNKAINDFSIVIKLNPNNILAYYYRGEVNVCNNVFDKAIIDYTEAIRLKPDYSDAINKRGIAYTYLGYYDNAINDFSNVIKINPTYAPAFYNRGKAYLEKHENEKALTDFNITLRLDPDYINAYFERGRTFVNVGEYDKAIIDFSKAIQYKLDWAEAYYWRGVSYNNKKQFDFAINNFNIAISLNPNDIFSYYILGNIYTDKGYYDNAITAYTLGLQIEPNNVDILYRRGIAYSNKHNELDYSKAFIDYSEVIKLKPDHAGAFYNRGSIYDRMKEYDKAISDFTEAINLGLNDEETYFARGAAFAANGNEDAAINDYENTLKLNPKKIKTYFNMGNSYWRKNDLNKAIENFNMIISLQPNNFEATFHRATIYEILKKYDLSLNDFCNALLIILDSSSNQFNLQNPENTEFTSYLIDKIYLKKPDLFWELPLEKLQKVRHFFVKIIEKFRLKKLKSEKNKKLIQAVYSFWHYCRYDLIDRGIIVYQYTTLDVLNKMRENKRFRLNPASYQNDPEEGQIFYKWLGRYFSGSNIHKKVLKSLKNNKLEKTVFIRSLTSHEDSLWMWNSYGDHGKGVSVGIPSWEINRGNGNEEDLNNLLNNRNVKKINKKLISLDDIGLYKIVYYDKDKNQIELNEIANCLSKINEKEFSGEFIKLLGELFSSIAHLIKDKSYAHEAEYRLLFIDSIEKEKQYIKTRIEDKKCYGVYVETEPILFKNDKYKIYFGPKFQKDDFIKYRDTFKNEGLPVKGSIDNMLKQSGIHNR